MWQSRGFFNKPWSFCSSPGAHRLHSPEESNIKLSRQPHLPLMFGLLNINNVSSASSVSVSKSARCAFFLRNSLTPPWAISSSQFPFVFVYSSIVGKAVTTPAWDTNFQNYVFRLIFLKYIYIYLTVPGLSCGMQYLFPLWLVESSSLMRDWTWILCTVSVKS